MTEHKIIWGSTRSGKSIALGHLLADAEKRGIPIVSTIEIQSFKVTLIFSEEFVEIDVCIPGFSTSETAEAFAESNFYLSLSADDLAFVTGGCVTPISREQVKVSIDRKWHTRTPVDLRDPANLAIIKQSMIDYESGVDSPFHLKEEDFQVVDWSFAEIFAKLECKKKLLTISQCLAFGVEVDSDNGSSSIADAWITNEQYFQSSS